MYFNIKSFTNNIINASLFLLKLYSSMNVKKHNYLYKNISLFQCEMLPIYIAYEIQTVSLFNDYNLYNLEFWKCVVLHKYTYIWRHMSVVQTSFSGKNLYKRTHNTHCIKRYFIIMWNAKLKHIQDISPWLTNTINVILLSNLFISRN